MSNSQNLGIVRRFIRMCNEWKFDGIEDFVHSDVIWHGIEETVGLTNFRQSSTDDQEFFPDMQFGITDEIEQQNKVVA